MRREFGDPNTLVGRAVDVMTRDELPVYGQADLFPAEFGGLAADLAVLAVELDVGTSELDALAALIKPVKGGQDLQ